MSPSFPVVSPVGDTGVVGVVVLSDCASTGAVVFSVAFGFVIWPIGSFELKASVKMVSPWLRRLRS